MQIKQETQIDQFSHDVMLSPNSTSSIGGASETQSQKQNILPTNLTPQMQSLYLSNINVSNQKTLAISNSHNGKTTNQL